MIIVYVLETFENENISPAKEVKFFELQDIESFWTGYVVQFGNSPATFHLSRMEAMDFIDDIERKHDIYTGNVTIRGMQMPPLKNVIDWLLNAKPRKEVQLEFRGEQE
jgi:hypothetical protein